MPTSALSTLGAARLTPVSASSVRQSVHDGRWEDVRRCVPQSTWDYLTGPEGALAHIGIGDAFIEDEKPVVTSASIQNITMTGYDVVCTAS